MFSRVAQALRKFVKPLTEPRQTARTDRDSPHDPVPSQQHHAPKKDTPKEAQDHEGTADQAVAEADGKTPPPASVSTSFIKILENLGSGKETSARQGLRRYRESNENKRQLARRKKGGIIDGDAG